MLVPMLCLAFALPLAAQAHYNTTFQYNLADNLNNCLTYNCLLKAATVSGGGTAALTQISTGYDFSVYGIDTSGYVWTLSQMTATTASTWSKPAAMNTLGYPAKWLAVRSSTEIYGAFMSTCGATPQLYRWDGSLWHPIGGCLDEISITSDDTLLGINHSNSTLYYTTNPTVSNYNPTWVTVGTGWTHVTGRSATQAIGVQGTTMWIINLTSNTASVLSGAPAVNSLTATSDSYLFVVTTGNVAEVYNLNTSNPTWQTLIGGNIAHSVAGSLRSSVFFLSGTTPYHLLSVALTASMNVNGYYDCSRFPNGCPIGSYHTATARAKFSNGYFGQTGQSAGSPPTNLNAYSYDVAGYCDPFYGDPTSSYCQVQIGNGQVNCSMMGLLSNQSGGGNPFQNLFGTGTELVLNKSGTDGFGCTKDWFGLWHCSWSVTPNCFNTPTYPIYEIEDFPPAFSPGGWWVVYKCFGLGTPLQACWAGPPGGTVLKTTQTTPAYCSNP